MRAARLLLGCLLVVAPALAEDRGEDALRRDIEFAREQVFPALVNIAVVSKNYTGGRMERFPSAGSGVIVSPAGHVLTNYHVAADAAEIVCRLPSNEAIPAIVIAHDPLTDLSVLKLSLDKRRSADTPLPFARLGDSDALKTGDYVLAMGNPLTLSSSMTLGIVGNPSRVFTSFTGSDMDEMDLGGGQVTGLFTRWIQHDALILPGNSGGPLVNLRGEVVGINELGGTGVGFAIPSNLASHVLNQALTHGSIPRGWLGLTIQPVDKMRLREGALVGSLQPSGPAEKAGLLPGDVILSIQGEPVSVLFFEQVPPFYKRVADLAPGSKARIRIRRGTEEKEVEAEVARMEPYLGDEEEARSLGITVRGITGLMALVRRFPDAEGVLVTGVRPGLPADAAKPSVNPGDILLEIGGKKVTDVAAFRAIAAALGKGKVPVRLRRRDADLLTVLDMAKKPKDTGGDELPKAWLGVETQVMTEEVANALGMKGVKGFRVTQVLPSTEAEKAGLAVGDVLTTLDGQALNAYRVQDAEMLKRIIERMSVGADATFALRRGGEEKTVAVKLEATPAPASEAATGENDDLEVKVRDLVYMDRIDNRWPVTQKGALVTDAARGGPAYLGGLRGGDLLLRVGTDEIPDVAAFEAASKRLRETKPPLVTLFVRRDYRTLYVFVEPVYR
jgi:serine protease Do